MFKKLSEAKVKDFMCQIMDTYETLKPKTKKAIVLKTCPKSPFSSKSKSLSSTYFICLVPKIIIWKYRTHTFL